MSADCPANPCTARSARSARTARPALTARTARLRPQAKAAMSPDYVGGSQETSIADFKLRIQQYSKVYEPMGADKHLSYVKVL